MRPDNPGRKPTWRLDPHPAGERECVDFIRESFDSDVPDEDEAQQSRPPADMALRSTPIRVARMCGFQKENL